MLSESIGKALNDQLNFELYSANIYLSMAAYFDSVNLAGLASWMKVQHQEEMMHMTKFYDYVNERGGKVVFTGCPDPPTDWDSPLAVFEHALAHERIVTSRINDLMSLAMAEKDHASVSELQWFVTEQVEEESSADAVVQQLKLMAGAPGGLFMLDRELGQRVFNAPPEGDA